MRGFDCGEKEKQRDPDGSGFTLLGLIGSLEPWTVGHSQGILAVEKGTEHLCLPPGLPSCESGNSGALLAGKFVCKSGI